MAFTLRSSDDILTDIMNYLTLYSSVTDTNPGSVALTLSEALSQELGENNFQISQILKAFSIFSAKAGALDRRVADFGIYRFPAKAASTKVRFYDTTVVVGKVAQTAAAGVTSLKVFDSTIFPTTGYPYVVRVGEGTPSVQNLTVSGNNTTTSVLTVTALAYSVAPGDSVNLVTGQTSRVINSGVQVQIPATVNSEAKLFVTAEQAYIAAGNTFSNEVICKSVGVGFDYNGASNSIRNFTSSPPFPGASVSNTSVISGGRDVEKDEDLQRRAVEQIFGLSAATKKALKSAAKQVEDPLSGSKVRSASVVEDFQNDEVLVYIDDGSGGTLSYSNMPIVTLGTATSGSSQLLVTSGITNLPEFGSVFILDGANSEVISYTSKSSTSLILSSTLAFSHAPATIAYLVEIVSAATEQSQKLFKLNNRAILRDSESIFLKQPSGSWTTLTRNSQYTLNRGTGEFVLSTIYPANSIVLASYSYNTALAAAVVRVLEGDPSDPVNFPGVKAAGVRLSVENPILRRVPVLCLISAKTGYDEVSLRSQVLTAVQQYFSSLEVGDSVIVDRLLFFANNVNGISSVKIVEPAEDVVILDKELATCFAANGDSLVVVS